MREILYRAIRKGKFKDGIRWIYGVPYWDANGTAFLILNEDLGVPPIGGYPEQLSATSRFFKTIDPDVAAFEIRPKTLGEYTGLTDKNGKKIFEGDIISVELEEDKEPELGEPEKWFENYAVTFDEEHHCWGTKISNEEFGEWLFEYDDGCASVIGNIHDNPELLGESHEHH